MCKYAILVTLPYSTECVTDLVYQQSEVIIFESIVTTFNASNIFEAAGAVVIIETKPSLAKLSLSKSVIHNCKIL